MVVRSSPSPRKCARRTAASATSSSAVSSLHDRHTVPPEKVRRQRGQILITRGVLASTQGSMDFVPVCPLSDLDASQKKRVMLGATPVALFRVEGQVYAIDD